MDSFQYGHTIFYRTWNDIKSTQVYRPSSMSDRREVVIPDQRPRTKDELAMAFDKALAL